MAEFDCPMLGQIQVGQIHDPITVLDFICLTRLFNVVNHDIITFFVIINQLNSFADADGVVMVDGGLAIAGMHRICFCS
jgi:hypothetical protein